MGWRHLCLQPILHSQLLPQGRFPRFQVRDGNAYFFLKLLRYQWLYKLNDLTITKRALTSYDIEELQAIPILFQTGYLTIKAKNRFGQYLLDYPNAEVKESMLEYMISGLRHEQELLTTPMVIQLYDAFRTNDLEQVIKLIKSIFKNIPAQIFLSKAEAYYHSLIYLVFFYLGQYTQSEVNTNNGRLGRCSCDEKIYSVVQNPTHIYILEFKLDESAAVALAQIKARGYADKYAADARPKVLIGINFSSQAKTVDEWVKEVVT